MAGDLMSTSGDPSHPSQHHLNHPPTHPHLAAAAAGTSGQDAADGQGRRMSDPVRPLDRNYGVGGQLSRHRSYGNLQGAGGRMPLHQQRVRGQEGAAAFMGGSDQALTAQQAQQQVR